MIYFLLCEYFQSHLIFYVDFYILFCLHLFICLQFLCIGLLFCCLFYLFLVPGLYYARLRAVSGLLFAGVRAVSGLHYVRLRSVF